MTCKLIHGDCLEEMQKLIDDGVKVDCVLTDLPYGTTSCKWDNIIPFEPMWNCINHIVKNEHTPILLFGNQPFTSRLINSNIENFKYCWTWDKHIPSGISYAKYRPMQQTEDICVFTKNGSKSVYNPQMIKREKPIKGGGMKDSESASSVGYKALNKTYNYKNPVTLIKFNKIRNGSVHPTQKPVDLLEYLIKTYSNEEDTILDFTMGSGSTGVACANLNRKFIGIELDNDYFKIAEKRIKEAYSQKRLI